MRPVSEERLTYGQHFSARVKVPVDVETAPLPVPYSSYYGVGRDQNNAEPHRHVVMETDIGAQASHVYQGYAGNFLVQRNLAPAHLPGNPGEMVALRERVNIENPGNVAAGSRVTMANQAVYAPGYAKVM